MTAREDRVRAEKALLEAIDRVVEEHGPIDPALAAQFAAEALERKQARNGHR